MDTAAPASTLPGAPAEPMTAVRPPRALLLAVPLLITLHNAEESATLDQGVRYLAARFPAAGPVLPSDDAILAGLAIATVVPWLVWLGSRLAREAPPWVTLLLLIQSLMLFNAAWHLLSAAVLGGVAPGLLTAVALNLPFSLYLLQRARREQWVSRRALRRVLAVAGAVHALPVLALLWLLTHPQPFLR